MPTSPSSMDTARAELCAAGALGQGGRAAIQRFSDCVDDLLRRLFDEAAAAPEASLIVALSTEGQKTIDVFHITKAGATLTDPAIAELTADFHRMLEA